MLLIVETLDGDEIATVCVDVPLANVMDIGGSTGFWPSVEKSTNSPAQIFDFNFGGSVAPSFRVAGLKDGKSISCED